MLYNNLVPEIAANFMQKLGVKWWRPTNALSGPLPPRETPFQIDHADQHGAAWVEREVLEAPSGVEAANRVVKWVGDDAQAADRPGRLQGCPQRKQ